jgi:hypothetical protein
MSHWLTLAHLPPLCLALVALASALAWQVAGALALLPLTPRSLAGRWRLALAWLGWLPVSGAAVLALVLLGVASRTVLLGGTLVVGAFALVSARQARPFVAEARHAFAAWVAAAQPYERWLWRIGVAMQVIAWLFAAHPQRLYDQITYHLVVGQLVVRDGQPFSGAYDPHVSFAGLVEYALAWHRAWGGSRLFYNAVGQVAVMAATVPVLVACGLWLGRASLGLLGLLCIALPGLIPECLMLRMAKPDGVIMTGAVLLLAMLARAPEGWRYAALAVAGMMLGCKITFGHAAIALAAAFVVARPPQGRLREWIPLSIMGLSCVSLQLGKNAARFGNPVYPTAASLFPSPWSDATTQAYWTQIAFGGESRLTGWLGPFLLGRDGGALVLFVLAAAALVLWRRHQSQLASPKASASLTPAVAARAPANATPAQSAAHRPLAAAIAFLAVFWATWPLFYGGHIEHRFIAPFSGGLFVLFVLLEARLGDADRRRLLILCACAGVLSAQFDRSLPGLWRYDTRSAEAAYLLQWPRLQTAETLNPELKPGDTIVADKPDKLYFDARVLFTAPLSPQERAILEELRRDPIAAALRYRVKALVVYRERPVEPLMQAIWQGLKSRGELQQIGPDRVLWSPCYFQAGCKMR